MWFLDKLIDAKTWFFKLSDDVTEEGTGHSSWKGAGEFAAFPGTSGTKIHSDEECSGKGVWHQGNNLLKTSKLYLIFTYLGQRSAEFLLPLWKKRWFFVKLSALRFILQFTMAIMCSVMIWKISTAQFQLFSGLFCLIVTDIYS